jgi:hypothetical protein
LSGAPPQIKATKLRNYREKEVFTPPKLIHIWDDLAFHLRDAIAEGIFAKIQKMSGALTSLALKVKRCLVTQNTPPRSSARTVFHAGTRRSTAW